MKDSFANGGVLQERCEMTRVRLNEVSIGSLKGTNAYNLLATLIYALADFFGAGIAGRLA